VHTELHAKMADALGVRSVPVDELPVAALERKALNGYLATNRALQPEMVGSLGLLECQAGPRCRRVVQAMRRLGVPQGALPFYEEHASADPRHGKDWLEGAVAPLVEARPDWGPRIVTGAAWRATVNRRFFAAMEDRLGLVRRAA
jgi:pyrroloquinoline quinone (PQQ) biosynthesis protein C